MPVSNTQEPLTEDLSKKDSSSNKGIAQTEKKEEKLVKITITLPTSAYFMSGIRDFTLSLTQNMTGFSEQWAYRFQSVVDELCNNAIEHGSSPGSEIRITFTTLPGQYLEVKVEDTGTSKYPKNAAEMNKLLEERKNPGYLKTVGIRGRGLPQIVASWTDSLEFKDREGGGLQITVRKNLNVAESEKLSTENNSNDATHLYIK